MCREFSKEVMQPQFGMQEQSTFLAKTVDFFKENEVVNIETFTMVRIGREGLLIYDFLGFLQIHTN